MKKFFILVFTLLFLPLIANAAGLVPCGGDVEPKCQLCHLFAMIDGIVDFIMITLVPIVAVLLLVMAGIKLIVSSGDPSAMKKGQQAMLGIVIGLVLIYGSWIIVNTLVSATGLIAWEGLTNGGWGVINCPIVP